MAKILGLNVKCSGCGNISDVPREGFRHNVNYSEFTGFSVTIQGKFECPYCGYIVVVSEGL
jgi:ribosomal protein S27E